MPTCGACDGRTAQWDLLDCSSRCAQCLFGFQARGEKLAAARKHRTGTGPRTGTTRAHDGAAFEPSGLASRRRSCMPSESRRLGALLQYERRSVRCARLHSGSLHVFVRRVQRAHGRLRLVRGCGEASGQRASTAPTSHPAPCGRTTPRASAGTMQAAIGMASTSTLPTPSMRVGTVPPLSARASSAKFPLS